MLFNCKSNSASHHWVMQRTSVKVFICVLLFTLLLSFCYKDVAIHAIQILTGMKTIFNNPSLTLSFISLFLIMLFCILYHGKIGMEIIIGDYVPDLKLQNCLIKLSNIITNISLLFITVTLLIVVIQLILHLAN